MKDFLKMFFASLMAIGAVGMGSIVMLFVLIAAVASISEKKPAIERDSALVFDMSVNIQDAPVSLTQEQIISELMGDRGSKTLALRSVIEAIDMAADDARISCLYLKGSFRPSNYGSGFAALKEVREAIERFKESGKPVLARVVYPSARDLYVASAANTLFMNPEGLVMNSGMSAEPIFFAGFFKKYGIGVQITKAGEYKSAAESLVLEKMSDPSREQTTALLQDLWQEYLQAVAARTGVSPDKIQATLDEKGFLTAQDAEELGLVDKLVFSSEVMEQLKELTKDKEDEIGFPGVSLLGYIQAKQKPVGSSKEHVAVVYAEGAIVNGEGDAGEVGGESLAREIRSLRMNEKVKAIVLRVNSPGGSALASEMIQHEVRLAREEKPVIVSMGTVAASGGYWISAYSDKIYAEPNTITGSIGVIGAFMNFKEIANRHGFTFDVVKTTKYADLMSVARPKNPEEMALIQKWVDKTYHDFLRKVSEGRGKPIESVAEIAEGRVWSGEDALELGLVDELGGLSDAIGHAAKLAGLGSDPAVKDYPKAKDFFEGIVKNLSGGSAIASTHPVTQAAEDAIDELRALSKFDDPKGVYAILPFQIIAR